MSQKNQPKLSILTPSIENRQFYLDRMKSILQPQIEEANRDGVTEVEWLLYVDNQEKPTGTKRNALLTQAKGQYVVFVDDDDLISHRYVSRILKAIKKKPDAVTFLMEMYRDGLYNCYVEFTTDIIKINKTQTVGMKYENVLHICPMKREIAISKPFPDVQRNEDVPWAESVRDQIKKIHFIDEVLYQYMFFSMRPPGEIQRQDYKKLAEEMKASGEWKRMGLPE